MTDPTTGRTVRCFAKAVPGFLIGLTVGVVVVAAVFLDWSTPNPVPADRPAAVVLPVTSTDSSATRTVGIKVVYLPQFHAFARRSGIVTEIAVRVGDKIRDGQLLAKIDGRPVVAMIAPRALFRDLSPGDRGQDVGDLQRWLRRLGYYKGTPTSRFDVRTRASVRSWQKKLGDTSTGRFELGSAIWIGATTQKVSELPAATGQSVELGGSFLVAAAAPGSVEVVEPPDGLPHETGAQVLAVGAVKVPYQAGAGRITKRADVLQVATAIGFKGEGIGRVRAAKAAVVKVLPASAVITDQTGVTCAFAAVDGPATLVSPVGGGLGGVNVAPDFPLVNVLANPTLVRSDLSCS